MAFLKLLSFAGLAAGLASFAACGNADDDQSSAQGGAASSSSASTGSGAAPPQSSSSSTGAGPVECSNGGYTNLPQGPCDLLAQNCPLGQSCEPKKNADKWVPTCVDNPGLKGPSKACQTSNECQPGLFCVFNLCAPVCCPATNEPCGGGTCNVEFSGDAANWSGWVYLCSFLEKCQVLTADACPQGTECHLQDFEQGLAVCIPPNGEFAPEGGDCLYLNDCGSMQLCYGNKCRYNCFVDDGGQGTPGLGGCPPGQTCIADDFGVEGVGICQP